MRFGFKAKIPDILAATPATPDEAKEQERVVAMLADIGRFAPTYEGDARAGTLGDLLVWWKFVINGKLPPRKDATPAKAESAPAKPTPLVTSPPVAKTATPPASFTPTPPAPAAPWRPNREQAVRIASRILGAVGAAVVDREPSDRAALDTLDRLLWQAHLETPWLDPAALAKKHWRPDSPTGLARSIRVERQRSLDALLKSLTTPRK